MSILLAIIAFQLFNISGNLAPTGRLDADRRACLEWESKLRASGSKILTEEEEIKIRKRTASKVGIKAGYVGYYCNNLP